MHCFALEVVRFVIANAYNCRLSLFGAQLSFINCEIFFSTGFKPDHFSNLMESLILAQNERWRRGLGMQVERDQLASILRERSLL